MSNVSLTASGSLMRRAVDAASASSTASLCRVCRQRLPQHTAHLLSCCKFFRLPPHGCRGALERGMLGCCAPLQMCNTSTPCGILFLLCFCDPCAFCVGCTDQQRPSHPRSQLGPFVDPPACPPRWQQLHGNFLRLG